MPYDPAEVRRRVRIIRAAYSRDGENAKEFSIRLGFGNTAWNNWEHTQRIGLNAAMRLKTEYPGLTLDWLYLGDKSGLPFNVAEELKAAEEELGGSEDATTRSEGRDAGTDGSKKSSSISRARSKTRRA